MKTIWDKIVSFMWQRHEIMVGLIIYTIKGTNYIDIKSERSIAVRVIETLFRSYFGHNCMFYVDNWYSNADLISWLHEQDTCTCGTVRANRKGLLYLPQKINTGDVSVHNNRCSSTRELWLVFSYICICMFLPLTFKILNCKLYWVSRIERHITPPTF